MQRTWLESGEESEMEVRLDVENTLWANTVLAAGRAIGVVVYTGGETRSALNNSKPRTKLALIDLEINHQIKVGSLMIRFIANMK